MKLLLQIVKENPRIRIEHLPIDLDYALFNCLDSGGGERGGAEVELLEGHVVNRQPERLRLPVVIKFELYPFLIQENLQLDWISDRVADVLPYKSNN